MGSEMRGVGMKERAREKVSEGLGRFCGGDESLIREAAALPMGGEESGPVRSRQSGKPVGSGGEGFGGVLFD